jgi:hypothetical protein
MKTLLSEQFKQYLLSEEEVKFGNGKGLITPIGVLPLLHQLDLYSCVHSMQEAHRYSLDEGLEVIESFDLSFIFADQKIAFQLMDDGGFWVAYLDKPKDENGNHPVITAEDYFAIDGDQAQRLGQWLYGFAQRLSSPASVDHEKE